MCTHTFKGLNDGTLKFQVNPVLLKIMNDYEEWDEELMLWTLLKESIQSDDRLGLDAFVDGIELESEKYSSDGNTGVSAMRA